MDSDDLYAQYKDDLRRQHRKEDDRREDRHREDFKKEMEQRNRIETARRKEILRLARKGNTQAVFAGLGIPWQPPPMGVSPGGPGHEFPTAEQLSHPDRDVRERARSQAIETILNDASLTSQDRADYIMALLKSFQSADMLRELQEKSAESRAQTSET